ncbi:hypothetical protein D3C76_112580 [compost metagenome]
MRSNILKNALNVSMENDDVVVENQEINPVTEETSVQVDEVLEQVRDAGDVVDDHEEVVEELDQAADSMESLIASLESAIADGGMSPQAADVHSRAVAIATRRLPVDASQFTVSVESYGGTGDKLQASMEALEGAKELLTKIWNGIKSAVQNAWKAVVNFVSTIGKSSEALRRAGKLLIAQANGTKGNAAGKKVDGAAVAKMLHKGGTMASGSSVGGLLTSIVSSGAAVVQSAKVAQTELTKLSGAIAAGRTTTEEQQGGYDAIINALPKGELPGGREIEVQDSGMPKLVVKTELKDGAVELDVPSVNDIKSIGQGIIKIADFIADYDKKYFKGLEKSINDFVNKQDQLIKRMELEKAETKKVRGELAGFKKISGIARAVGPDYLSYAANAAKASFNFGKKALAQYAKGAAPAAA